LDSDKIKALVAKGESSSLELKSGIPRPDVIAENLAAFANTNGGILLLGVREPDTFNGVDKEKARRALDHARQMLLPTLNVALEFAEVDGKTIAVARVASGAGPFSVRGSFFLRAGDRIEPFTPDQIRERILEHRSPEGAITELSRIVAQQSEEIAHLRTTFLREHSIARKLWIACAAAAFGALLKGIVDYFL
jgi:predicted HTH transcriptional regulator